MRLFRTLLCLVPLLLGAQDLKEFEKKVSEFTLANGLHFIVVERHDAPVVSFHTYVNAGSADDPSGATGIAHMFEHMAFKGTETIGTKNWPEEKQALAAIEQAYDRLNAEKNKGPRADPAKVKTLQAALDAAVEKANSFVVPNLFPQIIEENGGVGMNATTGLDATEYFYSLPSNRIELWFLLESQRFLHPVFREFYKERDVVMEEYRMRVESSPRGKLIQNFLATAFEAHPYRIMGTGWPSDIRSLRVSDALAFYNKYYVPSNITIGVVGDVSPAEARRLADKYFSAMPTRPPAPLLHTAEPPQQGPKQTQVISPSQPFLLVGYKRPSEYDKDDAVFDVMQELLAGGRTSRLYTDMVRDKRMALFASGADTFPGGKYPNLFVFFVGPGLGHTVEENEKELYAVLDRFKNEKVSDVELSRVKTKTRAGLIRRLGNNSGLASLLTAYYADYGDWRKVFTSIEEVNKVTADDVQRVARKYFVPESRTVAFTAQPAKSSRGAQ